MTALLRCDIHGGISREAQMIGGVEYVTICDEKTQHLYPDYPKHICQGCWDIALAAWANNGLGDNPLASLPFPGERPALKLVPSPPAPEQM